MKLEKKKSLAARTLGVGEGRIIFNTNRLAEIKEAITKQDIRDLAASGAIVISSIKGRKTVERRNRRRRVGSIRKRVKNSKTKYVLLTRKLRKHLFDLRRKGKISKEAYHKARLEIRASTFKSKDHMRQLIKIK